MVGVGSGRQAGAGGSAVRRSRVKAIDGNLIEENRDFFNALTRQGMLVEDAIRLTWTGKMAIENGFTRLKSLHLSGKPGNYKEVKPVFVGP